MYQVRNMNVFQIAWSLQLFMDHVPSNPKLEDALMMWTEKMWYFFTIKWFEVKGSTKEMKSELKMWIFVQINQLVCQKSLWRKFEYKIDHHGRLLRPPRQNKVRQIVFNPRLKLFPQKRKTVQCVHFSSILSKAILKWKKQNSWKTRWGSDDRSPANQIQNVYKNRNGVYPSWHSPHYGQRNHGAFPCLTPRPLS